MYRFILGILFVVLASDSICYCQYDRLGRGIFTGQNANLTQVPDDIPHEVRTVLLENNQITNIPINAFSNLGVCGNLGIDNNPIENIEDGAFHGLDKLTLLRLSGTSLTHLSQNMFQGLPLLGRLRLHQSNISKIARGAFSVLVSLRELYLYHNKINDIKDFTFLSLGNLTKLDLSYNQLEHLRPSTFAGLVSLYSLDLGYNKLTTLDPLVLSPIRRILRIGLDSQQRLMVCDIKLCWLKVEAEDGKIYFNVFFSYEGRLGSLYYPTCTGGVDWRFLQCPATLPCSDPGQVEFAERSGSFLPFNNNSQPGLGLPYSTDSQLRYTCDPCYTGGGTITCQSNGQWTKKPKCVRIDNKVICIAPALLSGYLTPSFNQYECGVRVTYACDEGFNLSGPSDGTCGPDGQFVGQIPSCMNRSNGSSGLIYGIVGAAVGGMILLALIGLTIFCVIRSKKRNTSDKDTVKTPNTAASDETSEAGYIGLVTVGPNGKQGKGLTEPIADRGTPHQRVAGDGTVYNNTAYEDEYQEIKDALPNEDPYEDVDEDPYEN